MRARRGQVTPREVRLPQVILFYIFFLNIKTNKKVKKKVNKKKLTKKS
jgi:hypothetical protein